MIALRSTTESETGAELLLSIRVMIDTPVMRNSFIRI
jgi:hypothetical protein